MIGTACFIFFLSLVTGRFFKRSRAFKKITAFLKKNKSFFNVLIFFTPAGNSIVSLIS